MSLFHVEVQEVIYRTYAVDADDKKAARADSAPSSHREIGFHLVSNLVTTVHLVDDACVERGCYKQDEEE